MAAIRAIAAHVPPRNPARQCVLADLQALPYCSGADLGYIEGRNYTLEFRSADGKADRLSELAAELVRRKVDVMIAIFTPCALAAKQATREIPIVAIAGDPIGVGLVASLARPGGNITGFVQYGC